MPDTTKSLSQGGSRIVLTYPITDGLDWMDDTSKTGAYAKIRDLQVNVAYPDFITDNTQLDTYYKDLTVDPKANIYGLVDALTNFAIRGSYKKLYPTVKVDRTDFGGPPTTTNAWYQVRIPGNEFGGALDEPASKYTRPLPAWH